MKPIFHKYFICIALTVFFYKCNSDMQESCRPSDVYKPPRGSIPVDSKEYLKCNKMRPVVPAKIKEKLRSFFLNDRTLLEIQRRLLIDINKGLAKNTHDTAVVKCYVTYVQDLPTGNEEGKFLALDLSGAGLRILLVEFTKENVEIRSKLFSIPKHIMLGSGEHLFDHVADCVYKFMKEENLLAETLPLGFTFGFPVIQKSLTSGILRRWTKGFNCSDVEGHDVVQLLQNAINRRGIEGHVKVLALINDTIGTLLSSAFQNPDTRIGVIVSTGTNACYLEKQRRAELFDGINMGSGNVLINSEWGAFGDDGSLDFIRTSFDKELDDYTVNPGKQLHEKMISGMYLGELVRLVLEKFTKEGLLFKGVGSDLLFTRDRFPSKYVSDIEADRFGTYTNCIEILEELGLKQATEQDYINVRYICECISKRAAYLVASGISALLNRISESKVTVGIDGKVYKYHPHFHNLLVEKISHLVKPGIQFELKLAEDSNGMGAALIAAVAEQYNII
ncbi:hypothetical protein WA026_018904 [Henosepilachna vigintioctopunctata]|uniref:Phosphotransferase n=1 Tax=Henosepilachna vigintioctopunctata TaxID=420089 RepID=A0AAW1UMM2_9CUCU